MEEGSEGERRGTQPSLRSLSLVLNDLDCSFLNAGIISDKATAGGLQTTGGSVLSEAME